MYESYSITCQQRDMLLSDYANFSLFLTQSNAGHQNSNKRGRTNIQDASTGELPGNACSKIPAVIYYNRCGQVRSGCRSTARACLGDGCGRGVDYGGMVGLCGWLPSRSYLHLYFQVQVIPAPLSRSLEAHRRPASFTSTG